VRYVLIVIIAASAAPLLYIAWLANPLSLVLFGAEWWRDRTARLYPFRWCSGMSCNA
jgi:O-antigen/teichoic acid export membrane protein